MSDEIRSDRKPAFHIHEPNRLLGNKVQLTLDPLMARSLCGALESLELGPDDQHLYAFAKHIRRYYGKMRSERAEEVSG